MQSIARSTTDLESHLLPLLRRTALPDPFEPSAWLKALVDECIAAMEIVLPLESNELAFLDRLLDLGDIAPELLTTDEAMCRSASGTIRTLPGKR